MFKKLSAVVAAAVLAMHGAILAADTPVTPATLGVDLSTSLTNFYTSYGSLIAAILGFCFGIALIWKAVRLIKGGRVG